MSAVSFQFAQVGRGRDAARFLRNLAKDAAVKDYVDCVLSIQWLALTNIVAWLTGMIDTSLDYIWDNDRKWGVVCALCLWGILISSNWALLCR